MLAHQLCLQQARTAVAARTVYLARATPASKLQTRCASTARNRPNDRNGRKSPLPTTGSRGMIGAAKVVNVDSVPTFVSSKVSNEGLDANQLRNLEREYKNYLQNPYKLAIAVRQRLDKDRYAEAVMLARRASKDGQVVVSWNYLIDYLFKKQRLQAAIKLFNEVRPFLRPWSPMLGSNDVADR